MVLKGLNTFLVEYFYYVNISKKKNSSKSVVFLSTEERKAE